MARNLITRREAIALLFKIKATGILDEDEERKLDDIIHCIEAEMENYHEWGGDTSEVVILHYPTSSLQIRSMDKEELYSIFKKYRFIPSENDNIQTQEQIRHMLKLVRGEEGDEF